MAVGGRKPSTEAARTGAGHRPLPDPKAAGGTITAMDPPDELSRGARDVWDIITPDLFASKTLRTDDLILLVESCEAWAIARWFRAELWRLIDEQERLQAECDQEDLSEEARDRAYAGIERCETRIKRCRAGWANAFKNAESASGDLGVGPVARVRLGLAKLEGASLIDALNQRPGAGHAP